MKAQALRVRFPAWNASVRSRHLSIVICRSSDIRCTRLRTASTKFVRKRRLRGQSRSSTAIEHPEKFGRRGFDSRRARHFRRAVEFGLSVKRETASAFKPRTVGQLIDSQLALLSVVPFRLDPSAWSEGVLCPRISEAVRLANWRAGPACRVQDSSAFVQRPLCACLIS